MITSPDGLNTLSFVWDLIMVFFTDSFLRHDLMSCIILNKKLGVIPAIDGLKLNGSMTLQSSASVGLWHIYRKKLIPLVSAGILWTTYFASSLQEDNQIILNFFPIELLDQENFVSIHSKWVHPSLVLQFG